MRIAISGGNLDDERHLEGLAKRAGHSTTFLRRGTALPLSGPSSRALAPGAASAAASHQPGGGEPGVLERALEQLERELPEQRATALGAAGRRPQALVFDAGERFEAAACVLAAVRRDPYFDRVGALLVLQAELANRVALPGGFDDFVLDPYSVDELTIRVRALGARRCALGRPSGVDDSALVVDEASRDVIVDGRAVQLTAREFALFMYLCEWRGRVLSREHLLARVWGSRYSGGRRTVDIHVRRLRAKLGASVGIETLRGSGYRLRVEPAQSEAPPASASYVAVSGTAASHAACGGYAAARQAFQPQIPEPFSKVS